MNDRLTARLKRIEVHVADHCTLACQGCNHVSPHLSKRTYTPEDYLPWLDKLRDGGATWHITSLTGGEPFVSKRITDFARTMKGYADHIEVVTNGFWLRNEQSIEKYAELWDNLSWIIVSRYPPYERPETDDLIAALNERIEVRNHHDGVVTTFFEAGFTSSALPIVEHGCAVRTCTQLMSDGRLARCTYGHAFRVPALVPDEVPRRDMFYDIDGDDRDLQRWADKYPLNCCHHCAIAQGRQKPIAWRST